ncbi:stage III sporulation protein AA [Sporohalobacter salinus]|uniref:stage III sporulation protein AA n=1 Tax=Sporohalobacter salinus TaxID=1494606 RepID=UPI00195FA15A|nr:stage III sporulation protein AA [Sporohalobacter salinus]MBM7622749.1 stage III sporulation protein AA [Sporohalobacter salinus]
MIERIKEEIFPILAAGLRKVLRQVNTEILNKTEEIRLRTNQPLILNLHQEEVIITRTGQITKDFKCAYQTTKSDIKETMNLMTQHSLYALEEELQQGYLTLAGGHRVGFVGEVVSNLDEIELIKNFSGLNIRISQEIIGAADGIIKEVISNDSSQSIYNTLIISPPQCGKTTLLRDLIRQLSTGLPEDNFSGLKVGVVDERGELGGSYQGVAQNQLGIRTDLLANCPKSQGMILLIRAMSPEVIVTDEIGSRQDVQAICEAVNAGVKVITSVHGCNLEEIKQRPNLKKLLKRNFFKRFIILSRREGPGTIEKIIRIENNKKELTERRKIL